MYQIIGIEDVIMKTKTKEKPPLPKEYYSTSPIVGVWAGRLGTLEPLMSCPTYVLFDDEPEKQSDIIKEYNMSLDQMYKQNCEIYEKINIGTVFTSNARIKEKYFRVRITKIVLNSDNHYICFAPTKEFMEWWEKHKIETTYMTITAKRPIKEKFFNLPSFIAAIRTGLFVLFDEKGEIIKFEKNYSPNK
jgi:hypothetical protein